MSVSYYHIIIVLICKWYINGEGVANFNYLYVIVVSLRRLPSLIVISYCFIVLIIFHVLILSISFCPVLWNTADGIFSPKPWPQSPCLSSMHFYFPLLKRKRFCCFISESDNSRLLSISCGTSWTPLCHTTMLDVCVATQTVDFSSSWRISQSNHPLLPCALQRLWLVRAI